MKDNLRNINDLLHVMYDLLPNDAYNSNILFINFYKPFVQHALNIKNGTFLYVAYSAEDKENVEMNENRYNENVDAVIMADQLEERMKNRKFDYCIMNPPYSGILHLKILEKIISMVNKTVNISPIGWLQDAKATLSNNTPFRKFEHSISEKIETLNVIPAAISNKMFNISWVIWAYM